MMEATGQTAPPATTQPEGRGDGKNQRRNAFGFLRLLFASLVIVSHFPQIADGNVYREPLYALTGTVGLGNLSVDGFFLISGYLVVSSFCNQPSVVAYLARRIARIVPGFVLASLFCLIIVAPLGGADFSTVAEGWKQHVATTLVLHEPLVPQAFAGTHYPVLNGSMWTIIHEFRCYIVVIVLGLLGAYRWRWSVPLIAGLLLLGYEVVSGFIGTMTMQQTIAGALPVLDPDNALRFTGIFFVGSTFYLFRDSIVLKPQFALAAAVLLVAILGLRPVYHPGLAEPAFAVLGGYIIFTIGFCVTRGPLTRINSKTDISYGVYLYAWPVAKLLLWYWPDMPIALGILINFVIACALGWVSWHLVEKRATAIFAVKPKAVHAS